jgi:hypothetical protein
MTSLTSIDIVIVNWNSGSQLFDCLKSLEQLSNSDNFCLSKVAIVDNASVDNSLANIEYLNLPINLIINDRNLGFAAACNQGAAGSNSDYLLFLNPDTRVFSNSISRAIEFLNQPQNAQIGICGVQLLQDDGKVSRSCSRFPNPNCMLATMFGLQYLFPDTFPKQLMIEWDHKESSVVDQVMGAFFLTRRNLYQELEGFDERFFVYFEEVDFAFRAKLKGWDSYYLSDAQIYHQGGGTTKNLRGISLFYYLRSRVLYCYKHFDFWVATLLFILTMIIEPLSRIVQSLILRSKQEFFGVLAAYRYLAIWCLRINRQPNTIF